MLEVKKAYIWIVKEKIRIELIEAYVYRIFGTKIMICNCSPETISVITQCNASIYEYESVPITSNNCKIRVHITFYLPILYTDINEHSCFHKTFKSDSTDSCFLRSEKKCLGLRKKQSPTKKLWFWWH